MQLYPLAVRIHNNGMRVLIHALFGVVSDYVAVRRKALLSIFFFNMEVWRLPFSTTKFGNFAEQPRQTTLTGRGHSLASRFENITLPCAA